MLPFSGLRQQPRRNLREVIPLEKPFSLTIDPCSLCNFRCLQCLHGDGESRKLFDLRMMTREHFEGLIDDLRAWRGPKLKVIKLYNCGEPLMNREFTEMLRYAKAADVAERIDLTSNCSLLTPEVSEKLVEYGLDYLRVSIYSPLQEEHERITRSSISVDTIYDNLRRLREVRQKRGAVKPFVAAKMFESLSDEENRLFLEKYPAVADEVFLEQLHNFTDAEGSDYLGAYYGDRKEEALRRTGPAPPAKKACPWPFMTLTVQSNGDVLVCCVDWAGHTRVGSIFESSLREIWEGETLYEFRKMHLESRRHENESCRGCATYLTDGFTVDNVDGVPVEQLRRKE